ncbi:ABC-three component system protein [Paenibacillus oryzisoli]|nr:ABC-three component system protein [Paenibacillus oryzisoli]
MQIILKQRDPSVKGKILVLFIHGLGAPRTWVESGRDWSQLIKDDPELEGIDVGIVTYDTSHLISGLFGIEGEFEILGHRLSVSKDSPLSIQLLAQQLKTILNGYMYRKYEKIVVAGHSMGGLIGKRFILNEYLHRNDQLNRIGGFISYATPYNGSKFAQFHHIIKRFQKHTQIEELRSNCEFLDDMNRCFADAHQKLNSLFPSIYCFGVKDDVVEQGSAVPNMGHSSTYLQAQVLPGDHGSILDVPHGHQTTNYDLLKGLLLDVLDTFDPPTFGFRSVHSNQDSERLDESVSPTVHTETVKGQVVQQLEGHRQVLESVFINRFRDEDQIRTRLIGSMNEVFQKLEAMDDKKMKQFLSLYHYTNHQPPSGNSGLRELWELLALVHLVYPDWNFTDPNEVIQLPNLQLDSERWVRILFSQDKETMPELVIGFIAKLYNSSLRPFLLSSGGEELFPYRLLLENINSESLTSNNPENLCEHCNSSRQADFSKILLQFGQSTHSRIFDGLEPNKLSGTVSISCSSCLRQVRQESNYTEICKKLRKVI